MHLGPIPFVHNKSCHLSPLRQALLMCYVGLLYLLCLPTFTSTLLHNTWLISISHLFLHFSLFFGKYCNIIHLSIVYLLLAHFLCPELVMTEHSEHTEKQQTRCWCFRSHWRSFCGCFAVKTWHHYNPYVWHEFNLNTAVVFARWKNCDILKATCQACRKWVFSRVSIQGLHPSKDASTKTCSS